MKQRLVGAIVLVALAVIFLPILLDGSGQSGPREIAIEIPAEPQPPANRLGPPRDGAAAARQPSTRTVADSEPAPAGRETPDPDAEARPSGSDDGTTGAPAGGDADGAHATAGADTPDHATETTHAGDAGAGATAGPGAWVVQVGSFTRETNALVLRDRLRAAEFDAFTERADSGGQAVWRVRVGPVATKPEAQKLSERLAQERDGPALVMAHP